MHSILYVYFRLFTIRFTTHSCQRRHCLFCGFRIVLVPSLGFASYCFVGYCHCYCHLDFNAMICKPLLIMQYLSKIRCCSSYCINEFICGKEYLLPFFPFNIWNFFRTKSKLWVLNQGSNHEGNSTALFSLINQLHNSMK